MKKTFYIEFNDDITAERIPFRLLASQGICTRNNSHLFTLKSETDIAGITALLKEAGFDADMVSVYDEEDSLLLTR